MKRSLSLVTLFVLAGAAEAQSVGEPGRDSAGPNPLNNVYFGEQHLHTVNSPDAFASVRAPRPTRPTASARASR